MGYTKTHASLLVKRAARHPRGEWYLVHHKGSEEFGSPFWSSSSSPIVVVIIVVALSPQSWLLLSPSLSLPWSSTLFPYMFVSSKKRRRSLKTPRFWNQISLLIFVCLQSSARRTPLHPFVRSFLVRLFSHSLLHSLVGWWQRCALVLSLIPLSVWSAAPT